MPSSKRPKALYQRGDFRLYRRPDRANLEIVWYDAAARRERSASAGTSDVGQGKLALDRRYLEANGERICQTCGRPFDGNVAPLLTAAITDYLLLSEGKKGFKATRSRLALAVTYVAETDMTVTVAQVSERWVDGFRRWLAARPIVSPKGLTRTRTIGHIEGCVRQLAAAINATPGQKARFKAEQAKAVSASPRYRADIEMLAAMFRYCLEPTGPQIRSDKERQVFREYRANLLRYLRAAVATWARPEELTDLNVDNQWIPAAGVLDLNPPGRRQTRKYRGVIPIPRQFAPCLDASKGMYMPVGTIREAWGAMRKEIGLPTTRGEAGYKLIRRSVSTLARRRIGEANWRQGEIMLGHVQASTSDIYALRDPANLGLALAATESIIDDISALVPGAFTAPSPQTRLRWQPKEGAKNG